MPYRTDNGGHFAFFYKIWINDMVIVPVSITMLVCLYNLAQIWSTLWTQILCGFGKIRLLIIMPTHYCPLKMDGVKN